MVIVDANVLLYATNRDSPRHRAARNWLESALSGDEPVGLAWVVLLAFVRVSTLHALSPRPLTATEACGLVESWITAAPTVVVTPTSRHAAALRGLLVETGTAGNLVTDAHLAALAVEYGARICSFDRDFARFPGVSWSAPG